MGKVYYHYCSLTTFMKIVESKNIRLCNVYKMNDSQENIWADKLLHKEIENYLQKNNNIELKNFKDQYYPMKKEIGVYATCFSSNGDKLSQWRGYADDGKGLAIGIDFEKLGLLHKDTLLDNRCDLWDNKLKKIVYGLVEYNPEKQREKINDIIQRYNECKIPNSEIALFSHDEVKKKLEERRSKELELLKKSIKELLILSIFFKNDGFKEEEEMRIAYLEFLSAHENKKFFYKNNKIISYVELNIDINSEVIPEIILGPKFVMNKDDNDLKQYLNSIGLGGTNIKSSEISYI